MTVEPGAARPRAARLPVSVNGRFLARPVTGVERFARMVLDAVHGQIASGALEGQDWTVVAPPGVARPEQWPGFGFVTAGVGGGHRWEQWSLPRAARGSFLVNLCNAGPVMTRHALSVVHDAMVYDLPDNFSRPYRLLHQTLGRGLARRSHLATVSAFSRERLSAVLGLPQADIAMVPNAADHVDPALADDRVVDELGLVRDRYLLFVGSFAPNKNLPRAIAAFAQARRPGDRFVLVGAKGRSFAQHGFGSLPEGVVLPGRIPDAALLGLYRGAAGLVFPSLYEGFGIPALEAMRLGCPVLAGDIPALRETCGDAALFCDPRDVGSIAGGMRRLFDDDALRIDLKARGTVRADGFSWRRSGEALTAAIARLAGSSGV